MALDGNKVLVRDGAMSHSNLGTVDLTYLYTC